MRLGRSLLLIPDVDPFCNADMSRRIAFDSDSIYEAAECDRASQWRQFWTITVPMVLPFLMLAVLFRGIENFKMFDLVVQLTGGGPGSLTTLSSDRFKARGI